MPSPGRSPRYLVPNFVTGLNIALGFGSMLAAARGDFDLAVYLLVAAIFCDLFDGQLARLLKATSKFGQQMDSLSDALSFGAAPAFLLFQTSLHALGAAGVACAVLYLLAGVLRLARFNLTSNEHVKDRRTLGVPIPIGAGYLMAAALLRQEISPAGAAAVAVVMALLMVSTVRLPQMKGNNLVSWMLLVGIANYLAVVVHPGWPTVAWWNIWNVLILLAAWLGERRREREPVEAA